MNQTTTSMEDENAELYFCTICRKKGHAAHHHLDNPNIYGNPLKFKIKNLLLKLFRRKI